MICNFALQIQNSIFIPKKVETNIILGANNNWVNGVLVQGLYLTRFPNYIKKTIFKINNFTRCLLCFPSFFQNRENNNNKEKKKKKEEEQKKQNGIRKRYFAREQKINKVKVEMMMLTK